MKPENAFLIWKDEKVPKSAFLSATDKQRGLHDHTVKPKSYFCKEACYKSKESILKIETAYAIMPVGKK